MTILNMLNNVTWSSILDDIEDMIQLSDIFTNVNSMKLILNKYGDIYKRLKFEPDHHGYLYWFTKQKNIKFLQKWYQNRNIF